MSQWLRREIWLVIGFINHLQAVTTNNYYTVAALHNLQSLHTNLFSLSALSSRVYNTGAIAVSLNHTLPILHTNTVFKSHVKSSQADFLYLYCHMAVQTSSPGCNFTSNKQYLYFVPINGTVGSNDNGKREWTLMDANRQRNRIALKNTKRCHFHRHISRVHRPGIEQGTSKKTIQLYQTELCQGRVWCSHVILNRRNVSGIRIVLKYTHTVIWYPEFRKTAPYSFVWVSVHEYPLSTGRFLRQINISIYRLSSIIPLTD
jgi:hypothetical protein